MAHDQLLRSNEMRTSKMTIKLAILFYSLVQIGAICITSILARISELFPQYSTITIQYLATCPSVMIIFTALLTGKLVEYIAKKYLALFSASLFIVAALGGFFFHGSLILLFLWQIVLGIGIGILVPLGTSLIADYFTGEERSGLMGLQSAIISVGGVLLSLISGLLATVVWYYSFLALLLIIPGFILLLFGLPLDRPLHTAKTNGGRIHVTLKVVIFYGVTAFLFMMFYNVISTNLSMHLKENGITGSVNSGIATAVFMLSGAVAGVLFKFFKRILGERVIALGFFNLAAGSLITGVAESFVLVLIGVFIAGFSLSIVMAQVVISIAEREKPAAVTMSIALNMAINNLGAFLSPNFTKISKLVVNSDKAASRYLMVGILAMAVAIVLFLILGRQRKGVNESKFI
jgi:MFS family permease